MVFMRLHRARVGRNDSKHTTHNDRRCRRTSSADSDVGDRRSDRYSCERGPRLNDWPEAATDPLQPLAIKSFLAKIKPGVYDKIERKITERLVYAVWT